MEALLFLLIPIIIGGGIVGVKAYDQRARDRYREHYTLVFPRDMTADQVSRWLRNIYGPLSSNSLGGAPTVVLEVWSTPEGITHRLKVPAGKRDSIVNQLRSSIPGTTVLVEKERAHRLWTKSVEVGLHNDYRPLSIPDPDSMAHSILTNLTELKSGETVMMQWVITAAPMHRPPLQKETRTNELRAKHILHGDEADKDEVNDRRAKASEPNMHAVLRVASTADDKPRAEHLVGRIRDALADAGTATTYFTPRRIHPKDIQEGIDRGSGPVFWPIRLGVSELAPLLAWPIASPFVAGLAPSRAKPLPASAYIPTEGRILGKANMQGHERTLAMSYQNALRHTHVIGPTGVGKTTLLTNMAVQDIQHGYGVIVIESKKDLFLEVLRRIPDHRVDDVIVLDVDDTDMPVGFNIFDQGSSRTAIDELSALIGHMYKDASQSIHAPQMLYHMTHALAEVPGSTFIDLPVLLSPAAKTSQEGLWRDDMARQVKSKDIRRFLQAYLEMSPRDQDAMSKPLYNRIWQFTVRREMKLLLGQRTSSFKMEDVIRDNKILLVNLHADRVGKQTASLVGTLLVNAIWQAVRTATPRTSNFLYIDEFQYVANLAVDIDEVLAKARSAGLGAVLAHQHIAQLPLELRAGVMSNTGTKLAFQTNDYKDSAEMARVFGAPVTGDDVRTLPRHDAVAVIATDKGTSPPVTMTTFDYTPKTGNEHKVRAMSRFKYGRPLEDVERGFEKRPLAEPQKPKQGPPPRPSTPWS